MASWKAWKTKTGDRIKKFVIAVAIGIAAVLVLVIAYRVGMSLYKKSLTKQIDALTAELKIK